MDTSNQYIHEHQSSYKKGLDFQREAFKSGKHNNDYDSMADALENIKSEIKPKLIRANKQKQILRIEKILKWYRTKEANYIRRTEEGPVLILPPNINFLVNKNLTIAYELLIQELEQLGLL